MKKSVFMVILVFSFFLIMCTATFNGQLNAAENPTWKAQPAGVEKAYNKQTILVKFKPGITKDQRKALAKSVNGKFKDRNNDGIDDRFANILEGRLALLELKGDKGSDLAAQALKALQGNPLIDYGEYNYKQYLAVFPNDPRFNELWGLHNTGQTGGTPDADIDAPEAWDISTGSPDVIVGVIDTGVDYTHQDLAANIWNNPGEIAGNGIDDDGNGFVDDIHGINAITGTGDPMDDHDHGTHCSGTIGGIGNNAIGVVGVNWQVRIIGMKFLNSAGSGDTADAVTCVNYAVALKNRGVNIRVLSNSWGGGGWTQTMEDAIWAANNAGIMFMAAAGNYTSNNDTSPYYPASYDVPNVVAVASTDHNDNISSFSNYGATTVELGAPGSSILSTIIGNSYALFSGTSMATPHVSGAAALLLSVNDQLTVAEIKTLLVDYGDPIPALAGKTISGKRLNVYNSLTQVSPPGPSFRLSANPTGQTVNQGQTAAYTIDIESILGFADAVNLSATSEPAIDAAITFTPNPGTPGASSLMEVATTTATAAGNYNITVTGESGSLTKTTFVALKVMPAGSIEVSYTNNTVIPIPDNNPAGITSIINVPDSLTIFETSVEVNITHTWIGDLIVKLISPNGTEAILHNREGSSADNIHQTYSPGDFLGENSQGAWTLFVSDNAGVDVGTLDSWTLTLIGTPTGPVNNPPTIAITAPPDGSTYTEGNSVTFTGDADDIEDGDLSASIVWSSSIDGVLGTGASIATSNLSVGTHTITASVTDSGGLTSTDTISVVIQPATAFTLSATGYKLRGRYYVDLSWSGAIGTNINVYRDGVLVATVPNTGAYTDSLGKLTGTFNYRVCETDFSACSNEVLVTL